MRSQRPFSSLFRAWTSARAMKVDGSSVTLSGHIAADQLSTFRGVTHEQVILVVPHILTTYLQYFEQAIAKENTNYRTRKEDLEAIDNN